MRVPAALVAGLVLAACQTEQPPRATDPATAAPTEPAAPTESAPATSREVTPSSPGTDLPTSPAPTLPALDQVTVRWEVVGDGFDNPLQVLTDPRDGATLVVEQPGRVTALDGQVVLDLTDRVTTGSERGLLGVAFHPDGQRVFVHYSGADGQTVLSQFPVAAELDPAAERVLLTEPQPAANHNGGALLFDPDGALLLGLGDGGGGGDQFGNGQDTSTRKGGILRLDVDTEPGRAHPAAGNPFADGGAPELWVYGLRNPWRIAVEDDWLYIADVGQDAVEEVTVVRRDRVAGANFGWPRLEGRNCFAEAPCTTDGTVAPQVELFHDQGACSIIGGVLVPPGATVADLAGAYLFSDLCDTRLRALRVAPDGDVTSAVLDGADVPGSPLGFGVGPDGEVMVGTRDGQVLSLIPG